MIMRPIAYLDLETTGTNIATDAIVSVGIHTDSPIPNEEFGPTTDFYWLVKPWKPIPPEVEELIGVTNATVENLPSFPTVAVYVHDILSICDLYGFNLRAFDVPLLWEEFYRCGIEWDLSNTLIIDAGCIFKIREERTLSAAMQFYCGKSHDGAHNALDDCKATREVLEAQLKRYADLGKMDRAALAKASEFDGPKRLSYDGKICIGPDGDAIYTFGQKTKGVKVKDDVGFARWILGKDFPEQTKMVIRKLLKPHGCDRDTGDLF